MKNEIAVFGGGCFWCTEAIFKMVKGVTFVTPGYAGGHAESPNYYQVCSGTTGHAEVIKIEFDADVISYEDLLEVFWQAHDPTTKNRQGNDIGTQYRSIILYKDSGQKEQAEGSLAKANASGLLKKPIVTEIKPLNVFYTAEDYHKDYFKNNPNQPYCRAIISPKIAHYYSE
ncbi:MAG: peptide-methionine (S)-S-oxide reductase MsrA [Anaerolineaceae bacterium]|jgi:peptide-methionine (S)-S-oxide reductase|nr:peptide-methionine (S)-S-oxide reductase MsrA [Anaerolineaceae bacterium]